MEITLKHGVEYDIVEPVAVDDLVKSIEAHARLMTATTELLEKLVPGLEIEAKRVSVLQLSQQSPLRELFAFSVVITYQKELEKEVPALIESFTGVELSDQYDTLVTVLVMLVAIYGVAKAFDLLFPGRSKENLAEAQESLAKRAAAMLGTTYQRVVAAVEVIFTGRSNRVLVGASQKVFAPTRNHPQASIRDDRQQVLVSPSATRDAQAASGLPYEPDTTDDPVSHSEFHRNVRIVLHAMDRDRKKRGWAGHCPDLFDDRIPMHLEKSIDPEGIFGKDEVRGDILLTSEEDEDGKMQPKEFLLVAAYL
ncbi:hypothetical protein [Shinella sp.]|uniref:hypothetical protein n=1 Tax=Shinella sp. TaxID=1870904 RepID=UPI0028AC098E|nr:hypothetical protein [Shinella sp.]